MVNNLHLYGAFPNLHGASEASHSPTHQWAATARPIGSNLLPKDTLTWIWTTTLLVTGQPALSIEPQPHYKGLAKRWFSEIQEFQTSGRHWVIFTQKTILILVCPVTCECRRPTNCWLKSLRFRHILIASSEIQCGCLLIDCHCSNADGPECMNSADNMTCVSWLDTRADSMWFKVNATYLLNQKQKFIISTPW